MYSMHGFPIFSSCFDVCAGVRACVCVCMCMYVCVCVGGGGSCVGTIGP